MSTFSKKKVSHLTPIGNFEGTAKKIKYLGQQKEQGTVFILNCLQRGTIHSNDAVNTESII